MCDTNQSVETEISEEQFIREFDARMRESNRQFFIPLAIFCAIPILIAAGLQLYAVLFH